VLRIRRRFGFPFLLAAQTKLFADALDPVNAYLNAVVGQIRLQTLQDRRSGAFVREPP